ncbi:MAG TPA: hypothetical protein VNJ02_11570 [Vicinamibacterales bacterium]|nr:hypothetical protein [Vicinamibacterales bacterium]
MPGVSPELAQNIGDLQRDLQNLASRRPEASTEFSEDVTGMMDTPAPKTRAAIMGLTNELATELPKAKGGDAMTRRLAELLFVASRRVSLPEERITQLSGDVHKLLTEHGVADARAKAVAGHVTTIARAVRQA